MNLIISNKTFIRDATPEQKALIQKDLTINNPKFVLAQRQDRPTAWYDKFLTYYEVWGKILAVPIGYTVNLSKIFSIDSITDSRSLGKNIINNKFTGKLRPYQASAISKMKNASVGVICAPTGSGKSVIIVNRVISSKVPTLILVNTLELLNQMIGKFIEFSDLEKKDIGVIGGGKYKIKDITISTLQSLTKKSEDEFNKLNEIFGQIIVDEVHIIPAFTFFNILSKLKAKYKFGFSATPKREDGLTDVIFWATGPIIEEIKLSDIKDKIVIPTVRKIKTNYFFPLFDSDEYVYMINDLCQDAERNKLIISTIQQYKGKQIVVLSQRVNHAIFLADALNKLGFNAKYLVSSIKEHEKTKSVPKKIRAEIIEGLNSGDIDVVCSTYSLFSTGIDIASLEILILAAPTKSEVRLKQSFGRLFRKATFKKTPEIVDFLDSRIDMLKAQGYARNKIYKFLEEV